MTDINLKTLTPDTSLPTTGFLFGADSQASTNPSVYSTQTVATTLLGSTSLTGGPALTADAPVLNLTQEWSNGSVAFTGIRYNVTNTNSAAASLLMDLQVGGGSQFSVSRSGSATSSSLTTGSISFSNWWSASQSATGGIAFGSGHLIAWNSAGNVSQTGGVSGDTYLSRRGAANLRFGAADAASPVAQTLSVQSIVGGLTGTPNLSAAAYPFTITGAQGTGTGAGGSIVFKVAPAAGSSSDAQNGLVGVWQITGAGNLTCPTDNTYDIGGSGVNRPRRLYMSSEVNTPFLNFTSAIQHSNGTFMTSPGNGFFKIMSSDQATKGVLITAPSTVANLPSAVTGGAGGRTFVTDATMTMALGIGTAVVGGGANKVPVYSDGASWLIG